MQKPIALTTCKLIAITLSAIIVSGCATIEPMGNIGSNKVYAISDSNFLSSSQMIVVLNKKGAVAAYSGGTTSGPGVVALETAGTVVTAGSIAYAGHAIQHGLETTNINASGIPSTFHLKADVDAPSLHPSTPK